MTQRSGFLSKQSYFLLENNRYALFYAAILAVIPLAAWLSVALVALITLRKGWEMGFLVLLTGVLGWFGVSLLNNSISSAIVSALFCYLPCYLAACVLRTTANWRFAIFFIVVEIIVISALVFWLTPSFIDEQYVFVMSLLKQFAHSNSAILDLVNSQNLVAEKQSKVYTLVYINIVLSTFLSTIISLVTARSVQSRLFYPGGFAKEMLLFRTYGLAGLTLLIFAALGSYWHSLIAISFLGMLIFYFVGGGLSLSFYILARDKGVGVVLLLLLLPVVLLPKVILPIYGVLGSLDGLFDFRSRIFK